jgi:hypothetical protein
VAHDDFGAGNREPNAHVELVALVVMAMWIADHDFATHDSIKDAVEFLDPVANSRFDCLAPLDVSKRDFDGDLHDRSGCIDCAT